MYNDYDEYKDDYTDIPNYIDNYDPTSYEPQPEKPTCQ